MDYDLKVYKCSRQETLDPHTYTPTGFVNSSLGDVTMNISYGTNGLINITFVATISNNGDSDITIDSIAICKMTNAFYYNGDDADWRWSSNDPIVFDIVNLSETLTVGAGESATITINEVTSIV